MRRRRALAALGGLAVAAAGCSLGGDTAQIACVWSGRELSAFKSALRQVGADATTFTVGDDIGPLLRSQVAPAMLPDVAIVPQPGLVTDPLSRLQPLTSPDPQRWSRLVTRDGRVYGIWFKVSHKSLVWHRRFGATPPRDWPGWVGWCQDLAAKGQHPLSLGAADGWVLTDWFENVLLGIDVDTYRRLSTGGDDWAHPSVWQALVRLGRLWQISGLFPGGPRRALITQFEESVLDVFARGQALTVAGADSAWPVIRYFGRYPAAWSAFPGSHARRPLVGGDVAVLLKDSEAGQQLISRLLSEAADVWARDGGLLPLRHPPRDAPEALRAPELWNDVQSGEFDLSDRLTGRLAAGEGKGTWRIFKDFFRQVAVDRLTPEQAADTAIVSLTGQRA
ncbi:hypothetical protein ABT294_30035 [Nonomuraea sp. NPDC000554]|uniref:hypothetical protein n=1 Tax=Nonomuraea sp. NPDC000554 TaxID=3154259 RepID=UPI00331D5490